MMEQFNTKPQFTNEEREMAHLPLGMENMPPERRAMGYDGQLITADDFGIGSSRPPQQQEMIVQQNPFNSPRYNGINLPDMPIQGQQSLAQQLINDDEVPQEIRNKYWYVFHKDNTLTFLDRERKAIKMLGLDIAKIDALNCMPYNDYDFPMEYEFNVLRNIYDTKTDRAMGFVGQNVRNERVLLQSQINESRMTQDSGENSQIKEGFFKRLLGRR